MIHFLDHVQPHLTARTIKVPHHSCQTLTLNLANSAVVISGKFTQDETMMNYNLLSELFEVQTKKISHNSYQLQFSCIPIEQTKELWLGNAH